MQELLGLLMGSTAVSLASDVVPTASELRRAFVEAVEQGEYDLPLFPRVAQRVMEAAQDERRGAAHVARLIERDPALCARVIAGAGSALYGGRNVVSIKQAVGRLGMTEVALLATTAAVKSCILRGGPYESLLKVSWHACVSTGLFAKEIARHRRRGIESAFLCGLLFGIGRPVALGILTQLGRGRGLCEESASELVSKYQARLGCDAVDKWKLPKAVGASIRNFENPSPPSEYSEEVLCVQLAAAFAGWGRLRAANSPETDAMGEALAALPSAVSLNLYPADIATLRSKVEAVESAVEAVS